MTHRGLASAFHVITGHEDETKGRLSLDYNILAKEEGTLVFLMGLKNLEDIARRLVEGGKDPATPAAVIQSERPPVRKWRWRLWPPSGRKPGNRG